MPRLVILLARCGPAAALAAALAAAAEPAAEEKLAPLPPAPLLLEKLSRGFLEAGPGRETLDDAMRRAAERGRAAAAAAAEAQRREFFIQHSQHLEQVFQPLLHIELALARRTCGSLPPAARREVLAAANQAVHDVAGLVARQQIEGRGSDGPVDVRRTIEERVAAALAERAATEEFAVYARETELRQARREETARIRIVARLDAVLDLTTPQRRAVLDDLRAAWRAEWIRELATPDGMLAGGFPPAPDCAAASIEPHLDAVQLERWKRWTAAAGRAALPGGGIDWTWQEITSLQQVPMKPDAWWRP